MPIVFVYGCASYMYVGHCMGAIMPGYQPFCMRVHVCDAGWRVFMRMYVCVCLCIHVPPHVYAQVGVH